jgi:hypothetical protein
MRRRSYFIVTAVVFAVVAFLHVLRLVNGWTVQLADWQAPMWLSWVGLVVAGTLSLWGFVLARAKRDGP